MIFYGILDILAFPVFLFYHVHTLSRIPFDSYGFSGLQRGGLNSTYDGEKRGLTGAGAGAGTVPMSGQNTANTTSTNGVGAGMRPVTADTRGDLGRTV